MSTKAHPRGRALVFWCKLTDNLNVARKLISFKRRFCSRAAYRLSICPNGFPVPIGIIEYCFPTQSKKPAQS